ncbi:MAG: aspartate-semialdehyde dehydrogenase [Acidimicrobiia bacterium]
MSEGRRVAVVGATGAVGTAMRSILGDRDYPISELRLMASERSAGSSVETRWGSVVVEDLATADPTGVEIALFSAGGSRSLEHAPRFVAAGAIVIDNSSAFRMDPDVPLVVADVNNEAVAGHHGIVANPNCTTMVLLMAVAPLHAHAGLKRLAATSYQSVSGSGQTGMRVLSHELDVLGKDPESLVDGGWSDPGSDLYARPIGYNVLPHAGSFTEQGYTDEEWKLVNETRKILADPGVAVEPTCVRVPVMVGHGISATMFFESPLSVDAACELLSAAPGIELWDDAKVPTPLDAAGIDEVLVGRVRPTLGEPGGIGLWAVGDNLRKGAALNAVQLAELVNS